MIDADVSDLLDDLSLDCEFQHNFNQTSGEDKRAISPSAKQSTKLPKVNRAIDTNKDLMTLLPTQITYASDLFQTKASSLYNSINNESESSEKAPRQSSTEQVTLSNESKMSN